MKSICILSAFILSGICMAADPATPAPDYKALYLKANDAARQWKEQAEYQTERGNGLLRKLQESQKALADATDGARRYADMIVAEMKSGRLVSTVHQAAPPTTPVPEANNAKLPTKFEISLPMNKWVLVSRLNGPNEWMCLTNVEQSFIEIAIGVGASPHRIDIKKGSDRDGDNLTPVFSDRFGRSMYWIDTPRQRAGAGIFQINDLSGQ